MKIPKLLNRTYYKFTRPLITIEPTNIICDEGYVTFSGFSGNHPFLRKESFILEAYRKAGYPFGKSIRGLKRFAKKNYDYSN